MFHYVYTDIQFPLSHTHTFTNFSNVLFQLGHFKVRIFSKYLSFYFTKKDMRLEFLFCSFVFQIFVGN